MAVQRKTGVVKKKKVARKTGKPVKLMKQHERSRKGRKNHDRSASKLMDGRQKSASSHDGPASGSIGRKSLTDRLANMPALAGAKFGWFAFGGGNVFIDAHTYTFNRDFPEWVATRFVCAKCKRARNG